MLNESLKNVMTQGYLYVEEDQAAGKAMRVMRDMHISSVFVLKYDKPIGVITERKIVATALSGINLYSAQAKDIMNSPVLQLPVDATVQEACELMAQKEFRHLAVVDHAGYLKGTVTPSNIVNVMGSESFSSIAQVKDVMFPQFVLADRTTTLKEAAIEILEKRSCCAIVVEDGELVGLVSEKDVANCLGFGHNLDSVTLEKIMSAPVITINEKDSIAQAIITLRRHHIHRVVVQSSTGQVAGVLSLGGLARNIDKILS